MHLVDTAPVFTADFGSASVGAVTVDVFRADGTQIVTDGATTDNSDGSYSFTLDAATNNRLDSLRVEWSGTNVSRLTYEEIVGSLLFSVDEARGWTTSGLQSPLTSTDDYPDALLGGWHDHIARQFESRTARGWIRRHVRIEACGNGRHALSVWPAQPRTSDGAPLNRRGRVKPSRVISATVNGVVLDPVTVETSGGFLLRTDGSWSRGSRTDPFNVVVEYEYGDLFVDPEAHDNGLSMIVAKAQPSDIPSFATAYNNQDGSQTLLRQGEGGGWSYPRDVFEWLKRNDRRVLFA